MFTKKKNKNKKIHENILFDIIKIAIIKVDIKKNSFNLY